MPVITFIHADGRRTQVTAKPGESVMEAAVANEVAGIVAECGGSAVCGTCHVFVEAADLARLPPIKPLEDELLDNTAVPRRQESRLSCQIYVGADEAGLTVTLPERQI